MRFFRDANLIRNPTPTTVRDTGAGDDRAGRVHSSPRIRLGMLALLVLLVLGLGCWVAVGAFHAKSNLEQARTQRSGTPRMRC